MASSAPLTVENLRATLATKALGQQIHLHRELASTNSEAMSLAQAGAAHGTLVVTESQTAGRGRHARVWFSPPGVNLYCSLIVRGLGPDLSLQDWLSWVPLTTALAIAESVQTVAGVSLSLKWPNDLLLLERKVGGILCESSLISTNDPVVVIGIGLNVNVPSESFPEDLRPIATSLYDDTGQPLDRNQLLAHLLQELEQSLDELRAHGPARLRQIYQTRCSTLGKHVRAILGPERELIGMAEAIAADGALQIRPLPAFHDSPPAPLIDVRAADVIHLR